MEAMQSLGGNGYINGQVCFCCGSSYWSMIRLSDWTFPSRCKVVCCGCWHPGDSKNAYWAGIQSRLWSISEMIVYSVYFTSTHNRLFGLRVIFHCLLYRSENLTELNCLMSPKWLVSYPRQCDHVHVNSFMLFHSSWRTSTRKWYYSSVFHDHLNSSNVRL